MAEVDLPISASLLFHSFINLQRYGDLSGPRGKVTEENLAGEAFFKNATSASFMLE